MNANYYSKTFCEFLLKGFFFKKGTSNAFLYDCTIHSVIGESNLLLIKETNIFPQQILFELILNQTKAIHFNLMIYSNTHTQFKQQKHFN